jgi:mRNA interferase RelE/StbE
MYEIIFDEKAIDFLDGLPDKERIFNKIMSVKEDPYHFFERLSGRTDYRMRIGDYRVIADIDQSRKTIYITLIGHRKNIYDRI